MKSDKYLVIRGGYSYRNSLSCASCGRHLGRYQKDGPGPLKRLYVDRCDQRILRTQPAYRSGARWDCPSCGAYLAFAAQYRKERRKAWYLLVDSIAVKRGEKIYATSKRRK